MLLPDIKQAHLGPDNPLESLDKAVFKVMFKGCLAFQLSGENKGR